MGGANGKRGLDRRHWLWGILGLVSSFATWSVASGQSSTEGVIHRVSPKGETYEDLAEHYYGKRYLAFHLKLRNGRPEPLSPGTSIIIPTFAFLPVKRGQSLAAFAEAYLSDARRAEYLAELHGLRGRERIQPKPGTRLRVVSSLPHRTRPGESLRTIARAYYRDAGPERVKLLGLFNRITETSLRSGMTIRIPLDLPELNYALVAPRAKRSLDHPAPDATLGLNRSPPTPASSAPKKRTIPPHVLAEAPPMEAARVDAKAEVERPASPSEALDAQLETLERTCDDGDYAQCEETARKMALETASAPVAIRVEILMLRAVALIALARTEGSKEVFRELLKLDPEYDLDLYRTSPKVLDVFQAVAER